MKPLNYRPKYIITCEHATNFIPLEYQSLFAKNLNVLDSHQAFDLGALSIAEHLSRTLQSPFVRGRISRLMVDLNRSLHHPRCFSNFTQSLCDAEKQSLLNCYYHPYRTQILSLIQQQHSNHHQTLHLSIHSFTPRLNQRIRNADIGILYDPQKKNEKKFAQILKHCIQQYHPYRIRMNYPYLGKSDGLTSALRKQFSETWYLGFEIECNQELMDDAKTQNQLSKTLEKALPFAVKKYLDTSVNNF